MPGITIRQLEWRDLPFLRPTRMPSALCPIVKDWGTQKVSSQWMGINHCNACAYVKKMNIDYEAETGEVLCAAP